MGVGIRWLGHVTKEHGGGDHVLAGSTENRGVDRSILDDATIGVCRALLLEGSL
jgi:hypothetical protein